MSNSYVKNTLIKVSHYADPMDIGTLFISFLCFLSFIISQPLMVTAVPFPDMVLIDMLGYTASQDYMFVLYTVTAFLTVGTLCLTAYILQGQAHALCTLILACFVGYILLAFLKITSLSMIVSLYCLWISVIMAIRIHDTMIKQIFCHTLLMIAVCLMPHFAISVAGSVALFLLYPVFKKEISGLYYGAQILIMGCILILGSFISVFILGFDIQAFRMLQSYGDGLILSVSIYVLYYLLRSLMQIPRDTPLYYASLLVPLAAIALLAGRFTGTLI